MSRYFRVAVGSLSMLLSAAIAPAASVHYFANLSGSAESPPNVSPGFGTADAYLDAVANTLQISVSFSGLLTASTLAPIHANTPAPGADTAIAATPNLPGFPLGVTSGA